MVDSRWSSLTIDYRLSTITTDYRLPTKMASFLVSTPRLALIGSTPALARAAANDVAAFAVLLEARVPKWPPPLIEDTLVYTADTLDAHPEQAGWWAWYFIRQADRTLVGAGGLKGPPLPDGTVEIGYSMLEDFQRQGYATEAASGLIAWAFEHPAVTRVVAETHPELTASIRVMEKNGLTFSGAGSEDRVIRFELTRESHVERIRDLARQP